VELLFSPVANPHFLDITTRPLFSPAECEEIVARCDPAGWESARIDAVDEPSPYGDLRPEERSVTHQRLPVDGDGWPLTALIRALAEINDTVYRFRLWRLPPNDAPSVLRYETATNDHFRPHADTGPVSSTRKLSYSIQLSDPSTYDGCDLVFSTPPSQGSREQGSITVFPSFLFHTVTPVYTGVRHAIVGWAHGPAFQ
jgi:PKHD-type hydroxylase